MDFFIRPFFTRDKFINIEVPEGETKAFISIQSRDGKEKGKVAAELHELMNVAHGMELYRTAGTERFNRFAEWLNPKANEGSIGFVHRNGTKTTTWGLSLLKQGNAHRAFVAISFRDGAQKGNLTFPIDPSIYLLFERHIQKAVAAIEENSVDLARNNRQKFFDNINEKNGASGGVARPSDKSPFPA